MTNIAGKPFTQYTHLNITDEFRLKGVLQTGSAESTILVQSASDLSGILDSTKLYVIDGFIDMGSQSIDVPAGGLNLTGFGFSISRLFSTEAGYTMFTSPIGDSGSLVGDSYSILVDGIGSQVYNIISATGGSLFEFKNGVYQSCTSLGTVDNYRQGLEVETARIGGTPSLILKGEWDAYLIQTSLAAAIDDTMVPALFVAGAGFEIESEFEMDIIADLGALAPLLDFAPSNFPNPSTLQIAGARITRNGAKDPTDATLTPNISASDLPSAWKGNQGLPNTFVGGKLLITSETATTISTIDTLVDLAGTWTPSDLVHFDEPSNGQLRHLGQDPREYRLVGDFGVEGTSGNTLTLQITKFDSSETSFSSVGRQIREVNNFAGGRNVAFFSINFGFNLDQNDYVMMQIENNSGTDNVTVELNSSFDVMER